MNYKKHKPDEPEPKKASRQDAKTQRTRKAFLCGTFAALRLRVKVFAFLCSDSTLKRRRKLLKQAENVAFQAAQKIFQRIGEPNCLRNANQLGSSIRWKKVRILF
jgi:hypothetical protein